MRQIILGISAFYHDSAATLLIDGEIVAAAQEERFTRKKHTASFPIHSCRYVLEEAGITISDVSLLAFYDKPYIKFERLIETYHAIAPFGFKSFLSAIPVWIKEKLFMKEIIRSELLQLGGDLPEIVFPEHHLSHAASAFYPSPFEDAAILTLDGVGEWATTTICHGQGKEITILKELHFPHSIGLLYSAFTHYCGFKVNSGEYKLMGLAPYGQQGNPETESIKRKILDSIVDIREDGSLLLNQEYFNYAGGLSMTNDRKWEKLFGFPRRRAETALDQAYMNMALAIQEITEDVVRKLANTSKTLTKSKNIVLAGGVALNCVANGKLLKENIFDDLWVQPAAGDAGGSLGAALAAHHIFLNHDRPPVGKRDSMKGAYLGPEFSDLDIERTARKYQANFVKFDRFDDLCEATADLLQGDTVIGWFQGRMEFGPRALGNRSIIGDPRSPEIQKKLNLKIKFREGFRPFAPSVLEEEIKTFFDLEGTSPYMLLVAPVQEHRRNRLPENYVNLPLYERLYHIRSDVPSITHVDFSARIQSVSRDTNPKYWQLIDAFRRKTGYGVVVNTSFNVRGEPIVCTSDDAYRCFMRTEMDYLVMGNCLFAKKDQPGWNWKEDERQGFEMD
ncbi:carbamoyltransferase family protein [Desulfatirhabdium butyrativorans]|uniref:carbamoyltransferase family protein n=1 Tax=Desulfatirhabdium butyrativorans TaxID=340467 RepID=UPI00042A727C|nr:carbamoyltransferase [Desulfatirhabdium butyrativorans]